MEPLSKRVAFEGYSLIPFQLCPAGWSKEGPNFLGKGDFVKFAGFLADVGRNQAAGEDVVPPVDLPFDFGGAVA